MDEQLGQPLDGLELDYTYEGACADGLFDMDSAALT